MTEIRDIITTHRPLALGISEANLHINDDFNRVALDGYVMYHCHPTNTGLLCLVVYMHKSLSVNLRTDMMSSEFCSI